MSMSYEKTSTLELPPTELGVALSEMRLCIPQAQQTMQLSLTHLGQLTPIQVFRLGERFEVFDGYKRLRAARELGWTKLRVEVHELDRIGAKIRLLCCNAGAGLAELEEAWLVKSLYREDKLTQPQIALMLSRHKSWVCRRLALAEGLSDNLTANVRLGLISPTAAVEIARLQRCNQEEVTRAVIQRGLTTRQTAHLVQSLLGAQPAELPKLIKQMSSQDKEKSKRAKITQRTPGEQIVAAAWSIKGPAARLHARLLERSLGSLGEAALVVSRELEELRSTLVALVTTIDKRLATGEPKYGKT